MQPDNPTTLRGAINELLSLLPRRQEKIVRLRFGLGDGHQRSRQDVALMFNRSVSWVGRLERKAIHRLDKATAAGPMELRQALSLGSTEKRRLIDAVERVRALTPDVLARLRAHSDDLEKVQWEVFEHLVAELLAQQGFEDVRLVGRDHSTSADIFAARFVDPLGLLPIFVEVKRTRRRVGVEVINQVLGAMFSEQGRVGWRAALLVSVTGFKALRRDSRATLRIKGITLADRDDLSRWLDSYVPNGNGLWLPYPKRRIE